MPVVLAALLTLLIALAFIYRPPERDILVSDSPDQSHRIIVRERMRHIDRTFRVVVVNRAAGTERVVYASGNQSPLNAHERFVWSNDSSTVVLVGDSYFVVPESTLENGEIVFLMYDVNSDKLWCNEVQDQGHSHVPAQQVVNIFGDVVKRPATAEREPLRAQE